MTWLWLYPLASMVIALIGLAVTRSALRAFVVAMLATTSLVLGLVGLSWRGYRQATAALVGPAATSTVVVDASMDPASLDPGEDPVARAWRLWLEGRLRVEPCPPFLGALRWAARAAPDASLELIRALSPHPPSV